MTTSFIGGGTMAEAIISGILAKKLAAPESVIASDVSAARRDLLAQKYRITVVSDNRQAVRSAEIVVLAIKPQQLSAVMNELSGKLQPGQTLLSIVAGARIATLTRELQHPQVVRAMPNTPAQVGEGMTVWTATPEVGAEARAKVQAILQSLGREIFMADEKYIDMATAVSGSGPAYVFLFIEAMIDAAVHLGLPRDTAREMVLQTISGSVRLARETGKHPAELKNMVTSPGGTTAEALLQLEEGGLRNTVAQAIISAYEKSRQLGG